MEKLVIAGREFNSRLFLGTGKFNSNEVMEKLFWLQARKWLLLP